MSRILQKSAKYVSDLINGKITEDFHYHNLQHTKEVVEAAIEIGKNSNLKSDELEILLLGAWFHDTGILFDYFVHEEKSIEISSEFLLRENFPAKKIDRVADVIIATKMPHNPSSPLQEIICDADIAHMAYKNFAEKSELLRKEWESLNGKKYSDYDWLQINVDFLLENPFYTEYALKNWNKRKEKNLKQFQERMRNLYNGFQNNQ